MGFIDGRVGESQKLCRWYLSSNPKRKRQAMWVGGFDEVVQSTMLSLVRSNPPKTASLSTVVCNHTRWSLWRMVDNKKRWSRGDSVPRQMTYEVNHARRIEAEELRHSIAKAMVSVLDYRRQMALRMSMKGMTLKEIGREMGVTATRIDQLVRSAKYRMSQEGSVKYLYGHCDFVNARNINSAV